MMAVQKVSLAFGLLERTKGPLKVTFDAEIKHTNNVQNTTFVIQKLKARHVLNL